MAKSAKKVYKPKFDWSGFKLLMGMGVVLSALGAFLFWAVYTAPATGPSELYALTTTQRLARMIPHETSSKISMVIASLFMAFGIFLVVNSIFRGLRFLCFKR